jgi:protein-L-isoaspartate(D-aspartate) O-methyltransferase
VQSAEVREQMIEQQVRAWDVLDERVLNVLRRVPRELFVPAAQRYRAYADVEVPLARAQHMLRPSVAGRLLQALLPQLSEEVLEIGAGSGFISACLRAMSAHVTTLEIFPELADEARRNLTLLNMRDVAVIDGDGLLADSGKRYDVIAVTGSLPIYTAHFEQLLKVGGRLFIVVGEAPVMDARLVRRTAPDAFATQSLFETVIDPLVNAARPPQFAF